MSRYIVEFFDFGASEPYDCHPDFFDSEGAAEDAGWEEVRQGRVTRFEIREIEDD